MLENWCLATELLMGEILCMKMHHLHYFKWIQKLHYSITESETYKLLYRYQENGLHMAEVCVQTYAIIATAACNKQWHQE